MVSLARFFVAAACGDAPTIAAFFRQRATADDTAEYQADVNDVRCVGDEWTRLNASIGELTSDTSLIKTAITSDFQEVAKWMFSTEAIQVIGAKPLSDVFPSVVTLALRANNVVMLELLLSSAAFAQLIPGLQQQGLLNHLLYTVEDYHHDDVVQLLIAHGADVNQNPYGDEYEVPMLRHAADKNVPELVDALVRDGALAAGAIVLDWGVTEQEPSLRRLLSHGGRFVPDAGSPLHRAASSGNAETTRTWLEVGFLDVDVHDQQQQTPLMHACKGHRLDAWNAQPDSAERTLQVAQVLLEHGATVTATDRYGFTALHFAVAGVLPEVVRLLLERGANPNKPNNGKNVPHFFLPFNRFDEAGVAETLALLLECGADPFALDGRGHSLEYFLDLTDAGRAFRARHRELFANQDD